MSKIKQRQRMKEFYFLKRLIDNWTSILTSGTHPVMCYHNAMILLGEYERVPAKVFKTDRPEIDKRRAKRHHRRLARHMSKSEVVSINKGTGATITLHGGPISKQELAQNIRKVFIDEVDEL